MKQLRIIIIIIKTMAKKLKITRNTKQFVITHICIVRLRIVKRRIYLVMDRCRVVVALKMSSYRRSSKNFLENSIVHHYTKINIYKYTNTAVIFTFAIRNTNKITLLTLLRIFSKFRTLLEVSLN